jgi:hypothetical protein
LPHAAPCPARAKKVLRYLRWTKDYMLMYKRTDNLEVIGYSDFDLVGCADTSTSTSSSVFTLANGAISRKNSKQTITTSSWIYTEFIACYEVMGQTTWLKNFILSLRVVDIISKPLILYYDNKVAISSHTLMSQVELPSTLTLSVLW